MKKWILLAAVCSLPLLMMAQDDDMYFVPTKENVAKEAESYGMPKNTYYSGSNRSVDDYNGRLSSSVTRIDSVGNEVETEDYQYTRQLSRFDDYTPSQAYWEGYRDGRWASPWYYGRYGWYSTWYDPWYASWYDPWYNSWYDPWYYGWSSPWRYGWYGSLYRPWGYYGYYGWYPPVYHVGGHGHYTTAHDRFHANRNVKSSSSFGNGFGRASGGSNRGGFGTRTNNNNNRSSSNNTFGTSRNSTGFGSSNRSSSNSSSFGSSRSSSSSSGGSFGGGSRSGGGGGGSRSGGGGGRFGR